MNKDKIIQQTANYVESELTGESTGHDWWHIYRVWKTAQQIGKSENADMFVVELAILLHDIADYKFNAGNHQVGLDTARKWLESLFVDESIIVRVMECIETCSFKKGKKAKTLEASIVQDADRLDAIGAIGIARVFATGSYFNEIFFDPNLPKENQKTATGHFYEKLLRLKEQMNTETGKKIASGRHEYLEGFLRQFYEEWEGLR